MGNQIVYKYGRLVWAEVWFSVAISCILQALGNLGVMSNDS